MDIDSFEFVKLSILIQNIPCCGSECGITRGGQSHITVKSNDDEELSDESLLKSNGDEVLSNDSLKKVTLVKC